MIRAFNDLPNDAMYDVCIVGSGPAGGTIANELSESGLQVCVLESGRWQKTDFCDQLKAVESTAIQIRPYSRERQVGGTSNTWGGLSSQMDPIDFERRPWLDVEGWPISWQCLQPYYQQAIEKYRFPPLESFAGPEWEKKIQSGCLQPSWQELECKSFLARAEPQNYSREFQAVYRSSSTDLFTDATVIELQASKSPQTADTVIVRNQKFQKRVRAKLFILAANGIENARLLLLSKSFGPGGLGNEHDQVGRYFMNHPKNYFGTIQLNVAINRLPAYFGFLAQGMAGYLGLRLPETTQRSEALLNSYVRFEPIFEWSGSPGVESFIYCTKRVRFFRRTFQRVNQKKVIELRHYAETGDDNELQNADKAFADYNRIAYNLVRYSPDIFRYLSKRLFNRRAAPVTRIRIRNFMEMEPRGENRVTLSNRMDHFGNPFPSVAAQTSARDRYTLAKIHQQLAGELVRQGWGCLESPLLASKSPWPINDDASHHLGTTRMGNDPRQSVVDSDCRIHNCENVYVAGGSVFSTSGNANPTFTIVALSIRLAEQVKRHLHVDKR